MRRVVQRAWVWRLLTALLAVALLFNAPVMRAASQSCLDGHNQVVDSDAGDATFRVQHSPEQTCCGVNCVFCLAVVEQPAESAHPVLLVRVSDIPDNFAGHDPSPGFEPPRSMR